MPPAPTGGGGADSKNIFAYECAPAYVGIEADMGEAAVAASNDRVARKEVIASLNISYSRQLDTYLEVKETNGRIHKMKDGRFYKVVASLFLQIHISRALFFFNCPTYIFYDHSPRLIACGSPLNCQSSRQPVCPPTAV